jgi:broad specificity phosphatase PhoE
MKRTHQTAKIIAEEIGFNGIWEEVADFSEQKMGKYEGKTHAEIENEWKEKTGSSEGWETSYRNNEEEPYAEFVERISGTLAKVKQKYE